MIHCILLQPVCPHPFSMGLGGFYKKWRLLHLKPIPHAPDSFNNLGFGRISLYLVPYFVNMNRNGGNVTNRIHIPYPLKQLILGKHPVRIAGKK